MTSAGWETAVWVHTPAMFLVNWMGGLYIIEDCVSCFRLFYILFSSSICVSKLSSLERCSFTKCILLWQNPYFHLQNLLILYLLQWVKVWKKDHWLKKKPQNTNWSFSISTCIWQHHLSAFRWCSWTVTFSLALRNTFFLNNELRLIIAITLKKKKSNFATLCRSYPHTSILCWDIGNYYLSQKGKPK